SSEAKTVLTVPPRKTESTSKKSTGKSKSNKKDEKVGRPPPLDDDEDPFPFIRGESAGSHTKTFRFSPSTGNINKILDWKRVINGSTAWDEICAQCNVKGDAFPYKKEVRVEGEKPEDVDEAIRRLQALEEIYKRRPVKIEIPLVHLMNRTVRFKLRFLALEQHLYFSETFKREDLKNPYILTLVIKDAKQNWLNPHFSEKSKEFPGVESKSSKNTNSQGQKQDNFDSYNWPAIDPPRTQTPWTDSPSTSTSSPGKRDGLQAPISSSEYPERFAPAEEQKKTLKEAERARLAEARKTRAIKYGGAEDVPNEKTSTGWYMPAEPLDEKKHDDDFMNVPVNPMTLEKSPKVASNTKPGDAVRNYNFAQMKQALESGVTDSEDVSQLLAGVLGDRPYNESSFFEIVANARNNATEQYNKVFMHVSCAVVLEKVYLAWDNHVNAYWTILDRKFDFALNLSTRRYIRSNIKPFTKFIKRTTISPDQNVITCENIEHLLKVDSISYKTVSKYKLHFPFIAELTRIEKRTLIDQPDFNKVVGKTEEGNIHWTIEILNVNHLDHFGENETLDAGNTARWTTKDIVGEEPSMSGMVEYIKAMLILTDRCTN
ncbi:785_t:CDS:2, partial [Acaulospora colombiana]